jgi:serine/threonine protein kinase/Tol biopolymer transport system component
MDPARWRRVEEIYHAAAERKPEERAAFLAVACAGDEDLRREVESLLAQPTEEGMLDRPAWEPEAGGGLSPEAARLTAGQQVSHYQIQEKLGEGGMGAVYRAYDTELRRPVALKVLPPEYASDPERRSRLLREARAASALNHPNIVGIYEVGSDNGVDFIAMEFIEGKSLGDIIPAKGLPPGKTLNYAVQIASGLAKAHAAGVIHRDLKPANIMLTGPASGHPELVKLLDFGLARRVELGEKHDTTLTVEGAILGTPAYMSPEQAQGKPADVRSDVFSFGSVLYQMVTGRRAFEKDSHISTLAAVVQEEPRPLPSSVPRDLERTIARCLRKDPERRFQSMADVRVALLELKEESDSGRLPEVAIAPARRRAWLWAGAAVLVLALLGTGLWLMKRGATPLPQPSVVPVTTYPGSQMYPSFSPDGKQIAFSWDGEKGDKFSIYVKLLGETNALRLTTSPTGDYYPAWSPDGKRIAFRRMGSDGGIYTVSALGGAERKLTGLATGYQMSWSPDGKWLAMSSLTQEDRGIFLLPVEGGEPRRISNPKPPAYDRSPAFAPDGHRLAYAGCTAQFSCDVYVQELGSSYSPQGSPRQITRQGVAILGLTWSRDGDSLMYSASHSAAGLPYLWRTGIDSRQPPQRLEIAGPMAYCPSASPTASRLVFYRLLVDCNIWRYHMNGGMEPFIVSSLGEGGPQFSPDGTRIAFESIRSGEAMEIWVAQADGSKPVQMTNGLGRRQGSPSWSPDGRWIAFNSQRQDGQWGVYVMDAAGSAPRRITLGPSNEVGPFFSRNGKWLYFRSDRTGRSEIWRFPFAGGPREQVTRNGGYTAYESVDGETLFYTKGRGNSEPLFARLLSGGAERQVLPAVYLKSFFPVAEGIYYIGPRSGEYYPLEFFQFSSNSSRLLAKIGGYVGEGLSVSPDRKTILFSKSVSNDAHLMMIENFP